MTTQEQRPMYAWEIARDALAEADRNAASNVTPARGDFISRLSAAAGLLAGHGHKDSAAAVLEAIELINEHVIGHE